MSPGNPLIAQLVSQLQAQTKQRSDEPRGCPNQERQQGEHQQIALPLHGLRVSAVMFIHARARSSSVMAKKWPEAQSRGAAVRPSETFDGAYMICGGVSCAGKGMNSVSPGTAEKRPLRHSVLAASIRSLREETKFHQI